MAAEILVNYMYTVVIRNVMVLLEIIICAFFVEEGGGCLPFTYFSKFFFVPKAKRQAQKSPYFYKWGMNVKYTILFSEGSTQAESS